MSSAVSQPTLLVRSTGETIRSLFIVFALAAAAVALHRWAWDVPLLGFLGVAFCALGAVVSLYNALAACYEAPCPGCKQLTRPLGRGSRRLLCRGVSRNRDLARGELRLTPDDTVTEKPEFGAPLPHGARWPSVCCVCGRAATRVETLRVGVTTTKHTSVITNTVEVDVEAEIPHCAEHSDGATIGFAPSASVMFRSYAYLRGFCAANGVSPAGKLTMIR